MARKHRATGRKPPGGKRAGAGRPRGASNALPLGAVSAIRALRHRIPESVSPELADLAGEALETVVEVMRGRGGRGAAFRLAAARDLRIEVCGAPAQKHEHAGADGKPLAFSLVVNGVRKG